MNKVSRICFTLCAIISVLLLVINIYDGGEIWRSVLYAILILSYTGCLIVDRIQRRKGKKD